MELGHPDFVEGKDGPELRATFWSEASDETSWFVIKREGAGRVLTMELYSSGIASELMRLVESALEGVTAPAAVGIPPSDERLLLRRSIPRGQEEQVSQRLAQVLGVGWKQPVIRLLTTESSPTPQRRPVMWYGVPREQIPWYPVIDPGTCDGCGKCVEFCTHDVLSLGGDPLRAEVTNPFNCLVGCDSCASRCPEDAIQFPPREILKEIQQTFRSV